LETDHTGEVSRIDKAFEPTGTALMHDNLPAGMADAQLPAGEGDAADVPDAASVRQF
jgi:hypothetical protein